MSRLEERRRARRVRVRLAALALAAVAGLGGLAALTTDTDTAPAAAPATRDAENPIPSDIAGFVADAQASGVAGLGGGGGDSAPAAQPTEGDTSPGIFTLSAPSIGLDAEVDEYRGSVTNGITPPTLDRVSWWDGAARPSASADNTVYLYGHTWYRPAVFNELDALQRGADVVLDGDFGSLTYSVTDSFVVQKRDLTTDPRVTEAAPGRLVLIGCYRADGGERATTENVVVVAQLR